MKILVVDVSAGLAEKQAHFESQIALLQDYDKVITDYSRYSSTYLKEDEKIWNRIDVLQMLEDTIYKHGEVGGVSISRNMIFTNIVGPNLEEAAALAAELESHEMVDYVIVNSVTLSGKHSINIEIRLTDVDAGGEQ